MDCKENVKKARSTVTSKPISCQLCCCAQVISSTDLILQTGARRVQHTVDSPARVQIFAYLRLLTISGSICAWSSLFDHTCSKTLT